MKFSGPKFFKLRWAVALVIFASVAGAILLAVRCPDEPSHGGKPLRYWVAQLDKASAWDGTNEAAVAVRSMGADALPLLTQQLAMHEPQWRWWLRQQSWFPFRLHGREQVAQRASFGLACLREQAVPTLEQLLTNEQTTANAAVALARMAPVGTPMLVRGLTNSEWNVRFWCASVLSGVGAVDRDRSNYQTRVGETARLAYPVLMAGLLDTNMGVACASARALANLPVVDNAVLPALASASTNSALHASVRSSALAVLARLKQGDSR